MHLNFLTIALMIYLISLLPKNETKFIEIKSLNSGKYFVVFDNGLFIYNSDFSESNNIKSIEINSSERLIIIKHIYQENIYIFCLLNNYLHIYDEKNNKIDSFQIDKLIEKELIDYQYYNIIPYNRDNKLKLIISSLKTEKKKAKCFLFRWCWNDKYYNVYKDFNYQNQNLTYEIKKTESFSVPGELLNEQNICYILDSSFIIKCIYFNKFHFLPIQYNIVQNELKKSDNFKYFEKLRFIEIASNSNGNNNYLICPLVYDINYWYNNNFTICQICDKNEDFNNCNYIDNLYEKDCSKVKAYFFKEVDNYALICKTFGKFNLLIIDFVSKKVINRKIIYINCTNNKDYEDEFSLIYNNSYYNYELITEYNFTRDKICSFHLEEKDSLNNKTINLTFMETGNEEIKKESNITYDFSFNDSFYEEKTNKSLEDFLSTNIEEIMEGKEIGKNYEIIGDTFSVIIKPTNSPRLPNKTHVEFDECEEILRGKYNLTNSSIITFFQIEINNEYNNALYKQIKYKTYDEELKELDLSICKDVETQIHYAIKDNSNLDISKVSNYQNMGIDILNINDDFFTNLCHAFSSSNNDMILEDRIKYIFQNYSLCEEGCSYNKLDIARRSISCDCKIQGNISMVTNPLVFDSGKETSFFDSNIGVSRCYNLVFSWNNKSNNIGFIVFCILIIIYTIAIIAQITRGIKKVSDFLYKEMINYGYIEQNHYYFFENNKIKDIKVELSPIIGTMKFKEKIDEGLPTTGDRKYKKSKKKKTRKKKKMNSIKISQKTSFFEENDKCKNINLNRTTRIEKVRKKSKKKIENDDYDNNDFGIIKINIDSEYKQYYPKDSNQSLLNYTFDEAVRYDKRNILRVFYIYLLSKQIIFRTFLQKSPLELFPLKLTLFIFMLSCDFALNALFYFNDNISKKYHYAKNIFLFAFSNNLTIIIYSTLISYFLLTFLSKLSNSSSTIRNIFRIEEEKIKTIKNYKTKEETKKYIFDEVENSLKKFKIKIFILLIIETILILFFWYFVTAFCHVYSSTQTSWLLDTFLSILSRFIIELIFGILFAKLYRISVASNIGTFYKLLICIYDFS